MPIYEYVCEKCGAHLEVMQKISDEPLKRCKNCRGKLEKIFSRTNFQLKGSGWYKTDYASGKSSTPEKKTEKKSEGSSSSSGSSSGGSSSSTSGGSSD